MHAHKGGEACLGGAVVLEGRQHRVQAVCPHDGVGIVPAELAEQPDAADRRRGAEGVLLLVKLHELDDDVAFVEGAPRVRVTLQALQHVARRQLHGNGGRRKTSHEVRHGLVRQCRLLHDTRLVSHSSHRLAPSPTTTPTHTHGRGGGDR